MKIGRMRLARVECDDNALVLQIDFYIFHASNSFKYGPKFTHTFIAIFAFSGDLDRFQDGVIGPLGSEWVSWVRVVWSCGVHRFCLFL